MNSLYSSSVQVAGVLFSYKLLNYPLEIGSRVQT